jgi:hypothetical protein
MDNRLDIRFRFRPSPKTPNGILLNYLKKQGTSLISNEMMLRAARAFWLPEAYQDCGAKKGQELKKLAINMIFALEDHALHLRTVFGIERQSPVSPVFQQMPTYPPALRVVPQEPLDVETDEEDNAWNSVPKFDTGGL